MWQPSTEVEGANIVGSEISFLLSERFEVGYDIWLSAANYCSSRPVLKLDRQYHKCTVTKVIGPNTVDLLQIRARFHVDLLRTATG